MNINKGSTEKQVAGILKVLGSPFRIQILYQIGRGEACVCHLEVLLKKRQAYISQHLMVMRDAGILKTRRDGKYIFYRVADPKFFELIELTAKTLNIQIDNKPQDIVSIRHDNCDCPMCKPGL
ncbi:MAG: metalloregulator ArsR/SmtB family transcription factor [Anaerolineales bacterium]